MISLNGLPKEAFLQLPTRAYLVSATFRGPPWASTFAEPVAAAGSARQAQWTRVRTTYLAGPVFHIFRNRNEYKRWHYLHFPTDHYPMVDAKGKARSRVFAERDWMLKEVAPPGLD